MLASIQKNGPVRTAEIAVEQTAYHFDKLYTYTIPDTLGGLERGCRVLIPFGGGNRRRQGIVMALGEAADGKKLKPVVSTLDEQPLLNDEMLALALWLKERTFCTVFEAVRAMLPAGLTMRVRVTYRVAPAIPDEILDALPAGGETPARPGARAVQPGWIRRRPGKAADRPGAFPGLRLARAAAEKGRPSPGRGSIPGGRGRDRADSPVGGV